LRGEDAHGGSEPFLAVAPPLPERERRRWDDGRTELAANASAKPVETGTAIAGVRLVALWQTAGPHAQTGVSGAAFSTLRSGSFSGGAVLGTSDFGTGGHFAIIAAASIAAERIGDARGTVGILATLDDARRTDRVRIAGGLARGQAFEPVRIPATTAVHRRLAKPRLGVVEVNRNRRVAIAGLERQGAGLSQAAHATHATLTADTTLSAGGISTDLAGSTRGCLSADRSSSAGLNLAPASTTPGVHSAARGGDRAARVLRTVGGSLTAAKCGSRKGNRESQPQACPERGPPHFHRAELFRHDPALATAVPLRKVTTAAPANSRIWRSR
jgi:hypothetical protein